jgi:hypothetical protein
MIATRVINLKITAAEYQAGSARSNLVPGSHPNSRLSRHEWQSSVLGFKLSGTKSSSEIRDTSR